MLRYGGQILLTVFLVMVGIFVIKKVAVQYDIPVVKTIAEGV